MSSHGIEMETLARRVERDDFDGFRYIFGMDEDNIFELNGMSPEGHKAEIGLLGSHCPDQKDLIIRDPYYDSGDEGFEVCYQQCLKCLNAFLDKVEPGSAKK